MPLERLSLARTPTPLEPLERLSAELGAEVWVKRDDLTGLGLSGNKVRKLEFLLADALARRADTVLTTGGIQSNHARATAVAARRLGLRPGLLLRGTDPGVPEANLLLDRLLGVEVRGCSPLDYAERRDALLAGWARELADAGHRPYVIPEGGSNGLGTLAFALAATEVVDQGPFDAVVVALGSGGTVAGLALGGLPGPVVGVPVTADRAAFQPRIERIAGDATALGARPLPPYGQGWSLLEGYQGPAYAVATPAQWRVMATVAQLEGLLLDPVYTGKAMWALVEEVRAGRLGGRILFWHTGGTFGLFGRGRELVDTLRG